MYEVRLKAKTGTKCIGSRQVLPTRTVPNGSVSKSTTRPKIKPSSLASTTKKKKKNTIDTTVSVPESDTPEVNKDVSDNEFPKKNDKTKKLMKRKQSTKDRRGSSQAKKSTMDTGSSCSVWTVDTESMSTMTSSGDEGSTSGRGKSKRTGKKITKTESGKPSILRKSSYSSLSDFSDSDTVFVSSSPAKEVWNNSRARFVTMDPPGRYNNDVHHYG